MGWSSKLFGRSTESSSAGADLAKSNSDRRRFKDTGTCDMCTTDVPGGSGQLFTTQEVITTEAYWTEILEQQRSQLYEPAPDGSALLHLLDRHTSDKSDWCLCERCAEHLDMARARARCWDEAIPLQSNAAFAAAYGWLAVFGRWPDAIAFREVPPPSDGSQCSQCGRRAYPDDRVAVVKPDLLQELEAAGAVQLRFVPSGDSRWVPMFCRHCLNRAFRIQSAQK